MAKEYSTTLAMPGRAALLASSVDLTVPGENGLPEAGASHDADQLKAHVALELTYMDARISSTNHDVAQLVGKVSALESAFDGLRAEIDELDGRLNRYTLALLVIIGLLAWMR